MLTLDEQLKLIKKIEGLIGEVHNIVGNPHIDLIHSLVSKIESLQGGSDNGGFGVSALPTDEGRSEVAPVDASPTATSTATADESNATASNAADDSASTTVAVEPTTK